MPAKAQDDRADKDFAAGRRFITQLRGFRRTDSFFKGQPRAFTDFNLWGRPRLLDEIIVGCSRMELGEEHEAFPGLLRSLVGQIEYINPRVSFGRFEILQVYNYLVDNAWKPLNPINGWKDICLDFVNEIADVTRDRHLSPSSFKYKDYVAVYKRLINAWIELKFGEGTYTQYIDCVKQSVLERAQVGSCSSRLLFTEHQSDSWLSTGTRATPRSSGVLRARKAKTGRKSSRSSSTANIQRGARTWTVSVSSRLEWRHTRAEQNRVRSSTGHSVSASGGPDGREGRAG